jgi:hypothetical protein
MFDALLLFFSNFVTVTLLVTQSINNNHGRRRLAMWTSLGIGVAQIATFKLLPTADTVSVVAWLAAGPLANVLAQWIKRKDIRYIEQLREKP